MSCCRAPAPGLLHGLLHGPLAGLVAALLTGFLACAEPPAASPILATWDGGEVEQGELDRLISSLPLDQRRPEDGDFDAWHRDWVREVAAREILLAEAEGRGVAESADFRRRLGELQRGFVVSRYLAERLEIEPTAITPADLETYRQEHGSRFSTPERRMVYHLFLRSEPGDDEQSLLDEAESLRLRVVSGEGFPQLAERYSDSELRHRRGLMGWVRRGDVAPALEEIVFGLVERQPSEPIATREGVHLFWVETALAARSLELDDARGALTAGLRNERIAAAVDDLLGAELPEGAFVPDGRELATLLARGDPQALILRIGSYDLRGAELHDLLAGSPRTGIQVDDAVAVVESIARRERLYLRAEAEGFAGELQGDPGLARLRDGELLRYHRERRLEEFAGAQEERLAALFTSRRGRYATPLRIRLRSLTVPLPPGDAADRLVSRLESTHRQGAAADPLETLAGDLGGRIEELGWVAAPQLSGFGPVGSLLAGELAAGEVSPPFRVGTSLMVLHGLEREEPQPMSAAAARPLVVRDLLQDEGSALYREMIDSMLRERGFEWIERQIEGLGSGRPGRRAAG